MWLSGQAGLKEGRRLVRENRPVPVRPERRVDEFEFSGAFTPRHAHHFSPILRSSLPPQEGDRAGRLFEAIACEVRPFVSWPGLPASLEARGGIEPPDEALPAFAFPLGYRAEPPQEQLLRRPFDDNALIAHQLNHLDVL